MSETASFDTIVLGAGAAGLFHAGLAGQRGRRVLVLDHAKRAADKVRISGGGRCNFTNLETRADRFLSQNPHFAKSALARYTAWDFISLMAAHGLTYTEKHKGQLFCDQKSGAIIQMLLDECDKGGAEIRLSTEISSVSHRDGRFVVETSGGPASAERLIIATGGLSIPKMGATGLAYDIARQFGHDIVETRPGLVPFTFSGDLGEKFAAISGVSTPVIASVPGARFDEDLLFTHRGLSGPAALQTSSYWHQGDTLSLSLQTKEDVGDALRAAKQATPKQTLAKALEAHFPARLAGLIAEVGPIAQDARLADLSHAAIDELAAFLKDWRVTPMGTEGYRTAEVTVGGIATDDLDQKTMESRHVLGLHFIGECVDVTGWLGGYNFQWAWASAHAAATL
ncbi:NAD(P)/FAD-dependent oxidoreductase [uncultured Hyphomonas sp.]|uniref:NAD(P)/FAD-dependent oxidoreductase n=1 Tax=uncultured Hyphomonas sp. TaxID=225298 RepID=UPI000C3ACCD1|nr:aminoacetone oxidase family FAD-binding enzyme [Hyphomonadaceae bacterium]MBA28262.1 aminoacetone oxidase family FAD-binding enzyme [Hyphomonadaceae bacterium]|tara:strand:+ start:833 stop:2023 length:1191 start_codon:yes stop_codon:yes gene_type:complete